MTSAAEETLDKLVNFSFQETFNLVLLLYLEPFSIGDLEAEGPAQRGLYDNDLALQVITDAERANILDLHFNLI